MQKKKFRFSTSNVDLFTGANISHLKNIVDQKNTVLITDENVFAQHEKRFRGWKTIVIKAGEQHKNQRTADQVIEQLIGHEADRKTSLIGIGGGVVTDITGYVASVYMRGISF